MKVYKFKRLAKPYDGLYIIATSAWEALEWLNRHSINDVISIEELGRVEVIVDAKETP